MSEKKLLDRTSDVLRRKNYAYHTELLDQKPYNQ